MSTTLSYPCPECSTDVPFVVRDGVDWWSVRCVNDDCGHEFQLWRCPQGHVATFAFYEDGDEAGHRCLHCGHRHPIAKVDDRARLLRKTVGQLRQFAPETHHLLETVQGALVHHMAELNPNAEEARLTERFPAPANRKQRRIVDKAAEAVAGGKLNKGKAMKLQRGLA